MSHENISQLPIRERLILTAINEISSNGVSNFSVRRVANICGVSCAAPYKHFKNRQEFFAAVIEYINEIWYARQRSIIDSNSGNLRKILVEISMEYIRFLVENPHFRSIIMLKDDDFDAEYKKIKGQVSENSQKFINEYCIAVNMPPETRKRKLFIVRSLIYGASLMFDNGELTYNEENFNMVAQSIDREFDLD